MIPMKNRRHYIAFLSLVLLLHFALPSQAQKISRVGPRIAGDFNGDGKKDTALAKMSTNPKTKARSWKVTFSDKTIPVISLGCCAITLINEGDLNHDKSPEISVLQAPQNGCSFLWTTYSFEGGRWRKFIAPFRVFNQCEDFTRSQLEKRVFVEKNKVYYWDVVHDNEEDKPVKIEVVNK
jgi:hypothetical protein